MPIINIPGVGQVRFPDEMSKEDIINAIENDILKRPKDQSRTWGEAGTDLAASLGKGVGQLAQVPGQIGMLSGLYKPEEEETGIQGLGKRLEQYSESQKSAGLKAKEAARAESIQAQTGIVDEARVALMSTITDPALITSFAVELVPNLIGGIEYTRLNPFLYRNFLPAQNYTSNSYILGDWIGQNSDKLLFYLKYSPLPRLKTYLRYQKLRNGPEGSMQDQYFGRPQLRFMENVILTQNTLLFRASYEYKNRLF
jgi:hypothetical protein